MSKNSNEISLRGVDTTVFALIYVKTPWNFKYEWNSKMVWPHCDWLRYKPTYEIVSSSIFLDLNLKILAAWKGYVRSFNINQRKHSAQWCQPL